MNKKLYVICNSHLDPVWIWRRRSGRSAWINTMHSVVRKLEQHPEIKFTASSSAMYRWIEENDPALFRKIAKFAEQGRWEITGGWEVQSDAIISRCEPLLRQAFIGKDYFKQKFGMEIDTGFCVDSFGHSAGLPKILNQSGISRYILLRPMANDMKLPLLFDWKADDNSCVKCLRILDTYNIEGISKTEYMQRIELHIREGLEHQTLFFGVGDHGGGLYEKHLDWLKEAGEKYDIVFSTLKDYFQAVRKMETPVVTGELGNVFRGCYSAVHEVKRQSAYALDRLLAAEKLGIDAAALETYWKELLFNQFHDILPGTCIMDAYKYDIFPSLGSVASEVNTRIDSVLCRRAAKEDTLFMTEGGIYIRNTESHSRKAVISVTGFADPNENGVLFDSLTGKDGAVIPLQLLPPPTTFGPCNVPWANLTAVVDLAPNEERFLAYTAYGKSTQENLGFERQKAALPKLGFQLFADDHGTWGFTLTEYLHPEDEAQLLRTIEIADDPVASVLRTVWKLRNSEIQADLFAYKDIPELKIALRIDFQEKRSCLKMTFDHGIGNATFATGCAAGSVIRLTGITPRQKQFYQDGKIAGFQPGTGEVPMIDWCAVFSGSSGRTAAFYAADHHGCDHADGLLRLTLLRAVPYADHHPFERNEQTGYADTGMTFTEVFLSEEPGQNETTLPKKARSCLTVPEVLEVTCHEADPSAPLDTEVCPFVNEDPAVVTEAVRKNAAGRWEIHLTNHGSDTTLPLPGGKTVRLPAKTIQVIEI